LSRQDGIPYCFGSSRTATTSGQYRRFAGAAPNSEGQIWSILAENTGAVETNFRTRERPD
jgi:hypothetical protein